MDMGKSDFDVTQRKTGMWAQDSIHGIAASVLTLLRRKHNHWIRVENAHWIRLLSVNFNFYDSDIY